MALSFFISVCIRSEEVQEVSAMTLQDFRYRWQTTMAFFGFPDVLKLALCDFSRVELEELNCLHD
jgi:hypothetical protein